MGTPIKGSTLWILPGVWDLLFLQGLGWRGSGQRLPASMWVVVKIMIPFLGSLSKYGTYYLGWTTTHVHRDNVGT